MIDDQKSATISTVPFFVLSFPWCLFIQRHSRDRCVLVWALDSLTNRLLDRERKWLEWMSIINECTRRHWEDDPLPPPSPEEIGAAFFKRVDVILMAPGYYCSVCSFKYETPPTDNQCDACVWRGDRTRRQTRSALQQFKRRRGRKAKWRNTTDQEELQRIVDELYGEVCHGLVTWQNRTTIVDSYSSDVVSVFSRFDSYT